MLTGTVVALRELRRGDIEILHAGLDNDAVQQSIAGTRPYVPQPLERELAAFDKRQNDPVDDTEARFVVQRADDPDGTCLGSVNLWGINDHHRTGHIGISLLPAARALGYGKDAIAVICRYAFEIRSLDRVQLETLSINAAMQATALTCGFREEGRLRSNAWHLGCRYDELVYGLLAHEWRAAQAASHQAPAHQDPAHRDPASRDDAAGGTSATDRAAPSRTAANRAT